MKYFLAQTRPRRMYELGPLADIKFEKNKLKEVNSAKAYDLYVEASDNGVIPWETIDWHFENGERVYVDIDKNCVVIFGEELDDKDVFKMRLDGKVAQGTVE